MCTDGKPNRNDLRDGECFWGFVVQWKNTGNGNTISQRWVLLRFDERTTSFYFNAESNQLQRIDAETVYAWSPNTPPIQIPVPIGKTA